MYLVDKYSNNPSLFLACASNPNNGKDDKGDDDKNKKPALSVDQVKEKAELACKYLEENLDDFHKNPEKYKAYVDQIRADPKSAAEKAGLGDLMKPDATNIPGGIALIAIGLFLVAMGRRLFKLFLGISGFIIGGSAFLYILMVAGTHLHISCPRWLFWVIGLVGGFLGSAMFIKIWKWAVYGMSAYGGVMLGFWILGMISDTELNKYIERTTFLVIFAIIGLFLAHFIDEFVVITSSSLMGAFAAVFGYDMIHFVGFRLFVKNTFDQSPANMVDIILENSYSHNVRFCMIAVLFITVSGIYVQYRYQPRTYDSD